MAVMSIENYNFKTVQGVCPAYKVFSTCWGVGKGVMGYSAFKAAAVLHMMCSTEKNSVPWRINTSVYRAHGSAGPAPALHFDISSASR